ncbi:hydrolase 1, exosortase A system-associated [Altererythrobacter sp. H2]|uniref:hydrolase 1, exosortase A system-associated n=1 Tax=Altererythrobacter sp. H2 TaxID=3108391 RepID=UPI002B4BEFC2|nr:hydrolase 1, exosortase A system-associated [Altererythrobacter sp. H2]WRK94767.1 hydrolase 1, exosortase A system-associated [Altererythrobacter sp. H2]
MNRLPLTFDNGATRLAGTLDAAPGSTGLLLVTGGNEIRAGAFSGQALLSARIAQAGYPVFRFDRSGTGDSDGANAGFEASKADIEAALATFRAMCPAITRVIGFGNCDAASALMLAGGAGCEALLLSNPWTIDGKAESGTGECETAEAPPPEAIRARYLEKLRNPREVLRLLRGGVDLRKLFGGLKQAARAAPPPSSLAEAMRLGIDNFAGEVTFLVATADRTGQLFESRWGKDDPRIRRCEGASHAYVEPHARDWLFTQVLEALKR